MLTKVGSIDIDIGDKAGAVELQKKLMIGIAGRNRIVETIPANATIIAPSVLAINSIPRVGQRLCGPARVVKGCCLCVADIALVKLPTSVDDGINAVGGGWDIGG